MAVMQPIYEDQAITWVADRGVTFPLGFTAGSVWCGFKSKREDLVLIVSETLASAAGTFTQNVVKASSVDFSADIVKAGYAKGIYCSAGNANACNGADGMIATACCAELSAQKLDCLPEYVLVAHTGVIGKPYEVCKAADGLDSLVLNEGRDCDHRIAGAILTTDTTTKQLAVSARSQHWDGEIKIGGICKGSGMIAPNMATTLCFLTTDVSMPPPLLQKALTRAINKSFNRITVDGDTSTNDMCLILANGKGSARIDSYGKAFDEFCRVLDELAIQLAQMVARDGEGATKLIAITVDGAWSEHDAERIAKTIAESPLVKTAAFGNDPNWGRVLAAAGRSGVPFDPNEVTLKFGPHVLFADGQAVPFDKQIVHDYLKQRDIEIFVEMEEGIHQATVWTCDYSYDYIRINAEYHT